jgi:hypothetical protein
MTPAERTTCSALRCILEGLALPHHRKEEEHGQITN